MFERGMIVLTRSSKYHGYCVAGIDAETGNWIRLVSEDRETNGALTDRDLICTNGMEIQALDLIDAPCKGARPIPGQPENVLLDRSNRIEKLRSVTLDDVLSLHPLEEKKYLFGNQYASVQGDYVSRVGYSLLLIRGKNIMFYRLRNRSGQSKLKADFSYHDLEYEQIAVTDPDCYSMRNYAVVREAIMVLSLGEAYNGRAYKFIAKLFEQAPAQAVQPQAINWPLDLE